MDNDSIRVDLLKFRRKAFLSYPEGSAERKNFLKVILKNELRATEQEIPKSLINFVVEGKSAVFWNIVKKAIPWIAGATLCNIIFAVLLLHHYASFGFLFLLLGTIFFGFVIHYGYDYWSYHKSTHEAQRYLNDMNKYMNKISNDIKRLEGPR